MMAYALICTMALLLFLLCILLPGDHGDFLIKEGGVIESASVFGYFLCIALIIYRRKTAYARHFFLLILFFMLRELDFQERFTTMGIFKTRFFISEQVPFAEKAVGAMVILLLLYVSISILLRHSKDFFTGLKKRSVVSVGTLLAVIFLVVSKLLDGIAGKLKAFGIALSAQMSFHAEALEEIFEFGVPLLIFFTLNAHFKDIEAQKHF